jgi:integrase
MLAAIMSDIRAVFQKVGECLYRYSPTGGYYARIKTDGKEIRRSLETSDREIAKRKLADLKRDFARIDHSHGNMTLSELAERWLESVRRQKPKTYEAKALLVRRIKRDWPKGANMLVRRVKPSDIELFLSSYRFGTSARNSCITALRQLFAFALADKIIVDSPAATLRWTRRARPIRKTPSFEEFKAIVQSIREQQFSDTAGESADFVEFLGLAGLGQAEAASLTWGDINWEANTITTFRHKTKTGFQIPIYPQVRPLLERRFAVSNGALDENVFSVKNAKKAISSACKRLKLPACSHRSFRRMFITRAIELGVDVKVIAEWQGHRDGGQLILSTYSHVRPVHSQRMALLMTDEVSSSKIVSIAAQR